MRIPRIFTNQALQLNSIVALEEKPSAHIAKALRLQVGHPVILFNGLGGEYHCSIDEVSKKQVSLRVEQFVDVNHQSPLSTHIAVALAKGDKMEWIIQKATELGVNSITPIFSERSDVKLNAERLEKKQQQWQQIAISACEQSGRNQVPEIKAALKLHQWLTSELEGTRCIFHPHKTQQLLTALQPENNSLQLCFGSEGGFTEEEIKLAQQQGFAAVNLGSRILRAETAPIAVLGAAQTLWGDWA